jgi:hypothetical protein
MITVYEYRMTITDVEFDDVYNFNGLFEDHMEADRFLAENEAVGNSIIIHSITEMEVLAEVLNEVCRD